MEATLYASVVVVSTMKAQFLACFEATIHANWLQNIISGLGIVDSIAKPLKIYYDNSTIVFSQRTKNTLRVLSI